MKPIAGSTLLLLLFFCSSALAGQPFSDQSHFSKIFNEPRHYRILLPAGYETSGKSYPVIYYFHGHSDRYTVEKYDNGTDTIPKMADFVAHHDVIVVCVDGYVASSYTGFYGGAPYDIMKDSGEIDFGSYFLELIEHIDSTYRTMKDRRHRATSGLSMGGFMSLYLSARFPEWIGSASAFNPGHEFYVGDKGRRILWRLKDHVANHRQSMVRLVRASGDYISQYHEEARDAYARDSQVSFEFRQDEYHRHWATSIGETFQFHQRAFDNPALNNIPETWSYSNPFAAFEVRGVRVKSEGAEPGYVSLEDVSQGGMQVTTRRWAPDGPPVANRQLTILTAPWYSAGKSYQMLDYNLKRGALGKNTVVADREGRLTFTVNGEGHQIGFAGPGTGGQPPVLLPLTARDRLLCYPLQEFSLPVRVFNPRGSALEEVKVSLESDYPTVEILSGLFTIPKLESGAVADLSRNFKVKFTAGNGYLAPTRLRLKFVYDGWYETSKDLDVLVVPETIPSPAQIEILDGRTLAFQVFRQKGNQGGGSLIERSVTEGKGNGNGRLDPGEEATIWVKLSQGMDPFDKNSWHRCRVYSDTPWVEESQLLEEEKQREWTGAQERTSLVKLSIMVPPGTSIPLLLENESCSFHYTPDVRYGTEPLYQAFQLHTRHLHQYELRAP